MAGNTFGELFRVTTFGESHGAGLGCVIDGCPAGLPLTLEDIAAELRRRRPGGGGPSTSRTETDEPEILSGVFEGKTLGSPIAILVRNTNQRSGDYDNLKDVYRPGHADWTWEAKYGFRDHRGGGRSSARETLGRVAAGAVAKIFLTTLNIEIRAWTSAAASIAVPGPGGKGFDWNEIEQNPLRIPHREIAQQALEKLEGIRAEGDSAGCAVSCLVKNLPPGLGEPVFDKLDARLAAAMLSLGAAKGIEFGAGFAAASGLGSELNDSPVSAPGLFPKLPPASIPLPPNVPPVRWAHNNAGGVLGGISNGMPLEFTVAFKPVPSISKKQQTVNRQGDAQDLVIQGRHDACIAPRAAPVVEAMAALVIADLVLLQRGARL
ncbi:chorismate synthase [Spirochaetia bacterium]|nr:chorismate synthase [Spirochaetia bacterium]